METNRSQIIQENVSDKTCITTYKIRTCCEKQSSYKIIFQANNARV